MSRLTPPTIAIAKPNSVDFRDVVPRGQGRNVDAAIAAFGVDARRWGRDLEVFGTSDVQQASHSLERLGIHEPGRPIWQTRPGRARFALPFLPRLFEDMAWAGQAVQPRLGAHLEADPVLLASDFNQILDADDPVAKLESYAYVPPNAAEPREQFVVMTLCGANQNTQIAMHRAAREANVLGLPGIVDIRNATVVGDHDRHRLLESALSLFARYGVTHPPSVVNGIAIGMEHLHRGALVVLSGESDGTGHVAQILDGMKKQFLAEYREGHVAYADDRRAGLSAEDAWMKVSGEKIFAYCYGNVARFPDGPNLMLISMQGDPLPGQRVPVLGQLGTTKENSKTSRTVILEFPGIFPRGAFEAHNEAFLFELYAKTCRDIGLEPGDVPNVIRHLQRLGGRLARPDEVPAFKADTLKAEQWDDNLHVPALVAAWAATNPDAQHQVWRSPDLNTSGVRR